ncbi:hypothetical protein [Myxococcus virescens]|uniref:Preprotein translocase subunit SecB n=1 Tax=Myxococcus virescens TaxID=83456 RepID=A0A511HNJ9_9BACT|nr:hypothetical protein [Myxococcus virescens]GEL75160.1 hypothetical protein MVI01_69440 [Myxococcus virescens]
MNGTQRETLARMAAAFSLKELRQTHLEAGAGWPSGDGEPEAEVEQDLNIVVQTARQPSSPKSEFASIFRFDFAVRSRVDPQAVFVRVKYHVIAVYSMVDGADFTDDEIQLYSQTNGMVHVWPYLRAFIQSSCAQLGIPVVTLPPFRIGQTLDKPWQRQAASKEM